MVHQWGFFGSISAIRKIWSLSANSRSLQAAALKCLSTQRPHTLLSEHLSYLFFILIIIFEDLRSLLFKVTFSTIWPM